VLQTEVNALLWWDLRNSQEHANNNSGALYGWRDYGDYGVISTPSDGGSATAYEPYPAYYVHKLLSHFARGGDTVVAAESDHALLGVYAARRRDGSLALLAINKSPTETLTAAIALTGFAPSATAIVRTYGVPQDDAARTGVGSPDLAESTLAVPGPVLTVAFAPYSATVLTFTHAFTPRPVRRGLRH
jgi:alpha-L-arabinofuranosidase